MENKIKQNKMISSLIVFGGIFLIFFLLCLILLQVLNIIKIVPSTKVTNPITEVTSSEEMNYYLGYSVPIINTKTVNKYIVIADNKRATHARVEYLDSSVFDMEKGNKDVSGIYGGIEERTEPIDGINVTIYRYNDKYYALWSYRNYSYSYIANNNISYLINDVSSLISIIKSK